MKEKFADIFFLVDIGLTSPELQQVKTTLIRLVNQMNFSASTYRLGLAQYGQNVDVKFLFNAHQTKEEVVKAIKAVNSRRLQPNEVRNLGNALLYAHKNFFTAEAGSRTDQSFRQYLVIVSGKDSDDPVYKEARLLKSAGIVMISFSAGASMKELNVLSSPKYSYKSITNAMPILRMILEKKQELMEVTDGENI